MTNTTLDLQKMGLSPLSEFEMQEIEGGSIWKWVGGAVGAVVGFVVGGPGGAVAGAIAGFMIGNAADGAPTYYEQD